MTRLLPLSLLFTTSCTAMISVNSNPTGADVYVTDYPPLVSEPPGAYLARGQTPMTTVVDYFAWSDFYVWVGAPGYDPYVAEIPGQVKPGPLVGGCFFWPAWIWAYGPTNVPVQVTLGQNKL